MTKLISVCKCILLLQEFDKKASSQVRAMFDEIDCCLFENVSRKHFMLLYRMSTK